ncbi:CheY-specific phosphatase CheX [Sedimentibacter acidaminivorans]|uniref:CheY-specific phosphatase CheX n=1 Tax=Sedimentibacter acidaminivorans TaxID=913099 RepID=A0ABS4GCC7_9FIRM|nr:chemotaxis protein CheX [Sedimentibacter acidaminivorans]MBP1925348.1 CheY-specific phosphatase CheX [Sedimentibacter acidaminivorans]
MFTQFFGSYLLNNKIVSDEQLIEALEISKQTRVKLGVLAINAGYMTAEQIDEVHDIQATVDKKIGDIAVDMGYITSSQVNELLSSQKTGYLSLGQALVDKGYMNNAQFEKSINDYKNENKIEYITKNVEQNEKIDEIFNRFFNFNPSPNTKFYSEYISLLFRNIVRFIGDDFIPLKASIIQNYFSDLLVTQEITGDFNAFIAISCTEKSFISLASRFANENFTKLNEYVNASVGEFLNLQDGLFSVNISNEKGIELDLEPQHIHNKIELNNLNNAYLIPVSFTFGKIDFIISSKNPLIN